MPLTSGSDPLCFSSPSASFSWPGWPLLPEGRLVRGHERRPCPGGKVVETRGGRRQTHITEPLILTNTCHCLTGPGGLQTDVTPANFDNKPKCEVRRKGKVRGWKSRTFSRAHVASSSTRSSCDGPARWQRIHTRTHAHTGAHRHKLSLSLSLHKLLHKDDARSPCWLYY